MASPCLCKPPLASEPASHVKPVTKQTFVRASPGAAREAAPETLPNGVYICSPSAGKYRLPRFTPNRENEHMRRSTIQRSDGPRASHIPSVPPAPNRSSPTAPAHHRRTISILRPIRQDNHSPRPHSSAVFSSKISL